jgi:hypothetical protein
MNNDMFINHLAHITGSSRKQILDLLKQMSAMPQVKSQLYGKTYDKKRRKKAS